MHNFIFLSETAEMGEGMTASFLSSIMMFAVFGLLAYFMFYKPQKKQEKAITEMRGNLKVGDEISTIEGITGKVIQIHDDYIIIETGNNTRTKLKLAKWAVRTVEPCDKDENEEPMEIKKNTIN